MSLPVAKLGTLALRTLSKPIASRLKNQAAVHPKFRNFIICIAQINHRVTTRIQRRIYGHATDVEITPLNEEKAVQAATDLIGEGFIFSVAVAALIFEVQRSARSEARKEEARKQELESFSAVAATAAAAELKQREESLSKDLEDLKLRLAEIEHLAKGRGLSGILNFKGVHGAESSKAATPA
ncbi:hypothetical protein OsI_01119 [Oryza sativa Indica Group]|uniref:OPA3-like protein n=1 Tax=Oryza sativa subsp. indica TaxID=39946 RepID=B8ABF5_ORYSI|nr:hypothetical protein OsI_01119 [Oryza sativa Indica Group]